MIPLFKKGDIQLFGNCRLISLLSPVSKVFEKAAYGQLFEYFSSHALFYDSQYGFRKYYTTKLAALELVDRIHKEIDESKIPFSVFLDLSKAFDTLDHDILLHELQYYGITGTALDWFRMYLTERYQYVDYNGASSSMKLLTTGVPQGSILGPLLFIIYMNDIHTVSNNLNFILYAHDTTLTSPLCPFTYGGYHDINRVSTLINSEITKISEWLSVNKLSLNANKTKFMIFHNYQKFTTDSDIPQLEINNTPIEMVTEFNFLGITINEFMNWGSHSVKIANEICRTLGVMNCLKRYLPLSALKIMYDSLILSHIQFGITCWGFEWGRLAKLQKELFVSLQTVNIMRTQNRYLKICIYWKLPMYLMSSVWNFGTSSQIMHFQTIFDLRSNTIAVYMTLKPGTTIECMFFQPERLVHVTSCDIASQY